MNTRYALHEVLEVHEIATFKTISMTKCKTMQALVSDPELKAILQQETHTSTRQLLELSGLLSKVTV